MHVNTCLVRCMLAEQQTLPQPWCYQVLDKHYLHVSQASFYVCFGFLVVLCYFAQEACHNLSAAADRSGQCLGLPGAITAMSFSLASMKPAKGCVLLLFISASYLSLAYNHA
jgi:hypothetical protein